MDNYDDFSDEEIAEKVRQDALELYAVIIERYQGKLLRYATGLSGDRDKAADIVQDSFIKAFVNLKGFDLKKRFSSWIYRIAHNEAMNAIKKSGREISLPEDWDIESGEDIQDDYDSKETVARVEKCFGQMPVLYSEPLFLHYIEDRSYEEIGDILRMPMGTVATRISRAKKLMKKICQEI